MNKLVEGKGNLIISVEKLKKRCKSKEITSWKDISKSWTRWKSTIKLKSDENFRYSLAVFVLSVISYFTFVYHATSEGVRSGQLIKFSHRESF
jgi:hypothetical protein